MKLIGQLVPRALQDEARPGSVWGEVLHCSVLNLAGLGAGGRKKSLSPSWGFPTRRL